MFRIHPTDKAIRSAMIKMLLAGIVYKSLNYSTIASIIPFASTGFKGEIAINLKLICLTLYLIYVFFEVNIFLDNYYKNNTQEENNVKQLGLETQLSTKEDDTLAVIDSIKQLNKIKIEFEELIDKTQISNIRKTYFKLKFYREFDNQIEKSDFARNFSKETINRFKFFIENLKNKQERNPNKSILADIWKGSQNIFRNKEAQ